MTDRWTLTEMLLLAARGLGKVDALGLRGASLVSTDELTAMAGALAAFGLVAIPPGGAVPDRLIITEGDRA